MRGELINKPLFYILFIYFDRCWKVLFPYAFPCNFSCHLYIFPGLLSEDVLPKKPAKPFPYILFIFIEAESFYKNKSLKINIYYKKKM